jgi:hypothetical protein
VTNEATNEVTKATNEVTNEVTKATNEVFTINLLNLIINIVKLI